MKRLHFSAIVTLLAFCAFFASAQQTAQARSYDPGRIVIRYSPVLGINVGLSVRIDGVLAGAFTKGHVFVRQLSPGDHRISVYRNGREWDAFHMTRRVWCEAATSAR